MEKGWSSDYIKILIYLLVETDPLRKERFFNLTGNNSTPWINFQILLDSYPEDRNPNPAGMHGAIRFQSGKVSGLFFTVHILGNRAFLKCLVCFLVLSCTPVTAVCLTSAVRL